MIESTFGFDLRKKEFMLMHIQNLRHHLFRWRSILGDGNCYYRAVMFGFVENIIFERKISLLKNIIVDIYEKFSPDYFNTEKLDSQAKNFILSINKMLVIKILYLIFNELNKGYSHEHIQKAYTLFLKSFNKCVAFDMVNCFYIYIF